MNLVNETGSFIEYALCESQAPDKYIADLATFKGDNDLLFNQKKWVTMAKEFMFYIRNAGDAKAALSAEEHLQFIEQCEVYISQLKARNKLVAAQPIVREGFTISKTDKGWQKIPVDPSQEVQVGYYHILADHIEEAIEIAKENPEFAFVPSATIEVRPIKTREEQTAFVYPK